MRLIAMGYLATYIVTLVCRCELETLKYLRKQKCTRRTVMCFKIGVFVVYSL